MIVKQGNGAPGLVQTILKTIMLGAATTSSGRLFWVSIHVLVNLRRVVLGVNLAIFKEWLRVFGA